MHDTEPQSRDEHTLCAVVVLNDGLFVADETIGREVPIVLAGVAGTLSLPRLPVKSLDVNDHILNLWAPAKFPHHVAQSGGCDWGNAWQHSEGCATVKRVLLTFSIGSAALREQSTAVRKDLTQWRQNFIDFAELVSHQSTSPTSRVEGDLNSFDIFCVNANGCIPRPYEDPGITVSVSATPIARKLHYKQLLLICELCSKGLAPNLMYRMQLSAYRALHAWDYRQAIMETAAVAELLLTESIKKHLSGRGINFADQLLKKFRMLSGRIELAKTVGLDMPNINYQSRLVQPRNDVVHNANFPEQRDAMMALSTVDELLSVLDPLSTKCK